MTGGTRTLAACLASVETPQSSTRRLVTETFAAFRVRDNGEAILIDHFATFDEALEMAVVSSVHKSKLAIRRTNEMTGEVTLHLYAVRKRSKPVYQYRDYITTRIQPLYAEHLLDLKPGGELLASAVETACREKMK